MINTKSLIKMARKWQQKAALKRKRISFPGTDAPVAKKGHFVVYTADRRRFAFPISYLSNSIVRELLEMSEEEFGLPRDGPITLPCDSVFVEYLVSMTQRGVDLETERAILMSISSSGCSLSCSLHKEQTSQNVLVF